MVSSFSATLLNNGPALTNSTEQFAKVDKELGEKIRKTAEHKIENDHLHPHKSPWH